MPEIYRAQSGRQALFEVGVVREDVDKILDHSVAEVILLLEEERERERQRSHCAIEIFFFPLSPQPISYFSSTYHRLNHVRSLHAQTLDRLKDVQETFSFHPLQNVAERDEGAGPTRTGTEAKGRGREIYFIFLYRSEPKTHPFQNVLMKNCAYFS